MNKKTRILLERVLAKRASLKKAVPFYKRKLNDTEVNLKREIAELKREIGNSSSLTFELRNKLEAELVKTKKEIARLQESLKYSRNQWIDDTDEYKESRNQIMEIEQSLNNLIELEADIKKQLIPFETLDKMQGNRASIVSQLQQKEMLLKAIPDDQVKLKAETQREINRLKDEVAKLKKELLPAELIEAERELAKYQGLPPSDMITVFATHLLLGAFGKTLKVEIEKQNADGAKVKQFVKLDDVEEVPDNAMFQEVEETETVDQVYVYKGLNLEQYTKAVNIYIDFLLDGENPFLIKKFASYVNNDRGILDTVNKYIESGVSPNKVKKYTEEDLKDIHQDKFKKKNKFYNTPFAIDRTVYESNKDIYTLCYEPETVDGIVQTDAEGRFIPRKDKEGKPVVREKKQTVRTGTTNFKSVLQQAKKYNKLSFQKVLEAFYQQTDAWLKESEKSRKLYERSKADSLAETLRERQRVKEEKEARAADVTDFSKKFLADNSIPFNIFKNKGIATAETAISAKKENLIKEEEGKKHIFEGNEYTYAQLQQFTSSSAKKLPKNLTEDQKKNLLSWATIQLKSIESDINRKTEGLKSTLKEDYEFKNFGKIGLSCKGGDIKIDFNSDKLVRTPTILKALTEVRALSTKETYKTFRLKKPFLSVNFDLEATLTKSLEESKLYTVRNIEDIKGDLLKTLNKLEYTSFIVSPDKYDVMSLDEEDVIEKEYQLVKTDPDIEFRIDKEKLKAVIMEITKDDIASYRSKKVDPYKTNEQFKDLIENRIRNEVEKEFLESNTSRFAYYEDKVMGKYRSAISSLVISVPTTEAEPLYNPKDIKAILFDKLTTGSIDFKELLNKEIEELISPSYTPYNVILKDLQAYYMLKKETGSFENRIFSVSTSTEFKDLTDRVLSAPNANKDPGVFKVLQQVVKKAYQAEIAQQKKDLIENLALELKVEISSLVGILKDLESTIRENNSYREIMFNTNKVLDKLIQEKPILARRSRDEFQNLQDVFNFVLKKALSEEDAYKLYLKEIYTFYVNAGLVDFNDDLMIVDQLNAQMTAKYEVAKSKSKKTKNKKASEEYPFVTNAQKLIISKYLKMTEFFFTHLAIEGISIPPDNKTVDALNKSEEDILNYKKLIVENKLKGVDYKGFEVAIEMEQKKINKIKEKFKPLHIIEDSVSYPRTKTGTISKVSPWAEVGFNISDKLKDADVASDFEKFVKVVTNGMMQVLDNFNSTAYSIFYKITHGEKDISDDLVAKEFIDKLSSDPTTMTQMLKNNFSEKTVFDGLKKLTLSRKNQFGDTIVTNPFDVNISNSEVQKLKRVINSGIQSGKSSLEINDNIIKILQGPVSTVQVKENLAETQKEIARLETELSSASKKKKTALTEALESQKTKELELLKEFDSLHIAGKPKTLIQLLGYVKVVDGKEITTQKPAQLASNILKNVVFSSVGETTAKSNVNTRYYTTSVEVQNEEGDVFNRADLGVDDFFMEERLNENNIKKDIKTVGIKLGERSDIIPDVINLFGKDTIFQTAITGLETKAENYFLKNKIKNLSKLKFVANMKDLTLAAGSIGLDYYWDGKSKKFVKGEEVIYDFSKYSLDDYFDMYHAFATLMETEKLEQYTTAEKTTSYIQVVNGVDTLKTSYKTVIDIYGECTRLMESSYSINPKLVDSSDEQKLVFDLIEYFVGKGDLNFDINLTAGHLNGMLVKEFDIIKESLLKENSQDILNKLKEEQITPDNIKAIYDFFKKVLVKPAYQEKVPAVLLKKIKDAYSANEKFNIFVSEISILEKKNNVSMFASKTFNKRELEAVRNNIGIVQYIDLAINVLKDNSIEKELTSGDQATITKATDLAKKSLLDSINKTLGVSYKPSTMFNSDLSFKIPSNIAQVSYTLIAKSYCLVVLLDSVPKIDTFSGEKNKGSLDIRLKKFLKENPSWWGIFNKTGRPDFSITSAINQAYFEFFKGVEKYLDKADEVYQDAKRFFKSPASKFNFAYENAEETAEEKLQSKKSTLSKFVADFMEKEKVQGVSGVQILEALEDLSGGNLEKLIKEKIKLQELGSETNDLYTLFDETNRVLTARGVKFADALLANKASLENYSSLTRQQEILDLQKQLTKDKKRYKYLFEQLQYRLDRDLPSDAMRVFANLIESIKAGLIRLGYKVSQNQDGITVQEKKTSNKTKKQEQETTSTKKIISEEEEFMFLSTLITNTKLAIQQKLTDQFTVDQNDLAEEQIDKIIDIIENIPDITFTKEEINDPSLMRTFISNIFSKTLNTLRMGYLAARDAESERVEADIFKIYSENIGRQIRKINMEIVEATRHLEELPAGDEEKEPLIKEIERKELVLTKLLNERDKGDIYEGKARERADRAAQAKADLIKKLYIEYLGLRSKIPLSESKIDDLVMENQKKFGDLQQEITAAYNQSIKIFYNLAKELEKNIIELEEPLKSITGNFLAYLTNVGR